MIWRVTRLNLSHSQREHCPVTLLRQSLVQAWRCCSHQVIYSTHICNRSFSSGHDGHGNL